MSLCCAEYNRVILGQLPLLTVYVFPCKVEINFLLTFETAPFICKHTVHDCIATLKVESRNKKQAYRHKYNNIKISAEHKVYLMVLYLHMFLHANNYADDLTGDRPTNKSVGKGP